jgi:DNA-binding NtrC family response regulator
MKHILIVEDDRLILKSLSMLLSHEDTRVLSCDNLECAKEALLKHAVDLVITDLKLSELDGMEGMRLLAIVKKMNPSMPVIMMTGSGSDEIKNSAYRLGAYHYFEKPFDFRQLAEKARALGISTKRPQGAGQEQGADSWVHL